MLSGLVLLCLAALLGAAQAALTTDRPIIGIVAQHLYSDVYDPSSNRTYIAASYVKFIEASGGRVVPIFVNQTDEYYERIFNSVNGVLFPGGQADLRSSGYERATKVLFDLAVKANQKGTHFPIWGTCLGLEDLTRLAIDKLVLRRCNATDLALPLDFTSDYRKSRMFGKLPKDLQRALRTEPITYNAHRFCLTPENFTAFGLDKIFKPLSTNVDREGVTFISSFEGRRLPFYAVQFHPEKTNFEWERTAHHTSVPHGPDALSISQYLGNFFISEARKNLHKFATEEEEQRALIYNYPATFTQKHSLYTQMYIFDQPKQWPGRRKSRWGVRNSVSPVVPHWKRVAATRRSGRPRSAHRVA